MSSTNILSISKELKHGSHRTSGLLTTLGTICYSISIPSQKIEKTVLDSIQQYCSLKYGEQICRLALNCIANLLMKSEYCAVPMKPILVQFLLNLSIAKKINSIHELKLYYNVMRGLQYALPHLPPEEPNKVLSMYLALEKVVFLGAANNPNWNYQNDLSSPASSDCSSDDNYNSEEFYYSKIKTCALLCLQNLFKKHSQFLFSFWSWLIPTSHRPENSPFYNQSLTYILFNEKSEKVKIAAATTLSVMIENSALSKVNFEECNYSYVSLTQCMKYAVVNLHDALTRLLDDEQNPELISALLRVASALLFATNYASFDQGLAKPLIKSIICHAKSKENNVKIGVISALTSAFKETNEDLRGFLTLEFTQGILNSGNFIAERLQLVSKIARSYPEVLNKMTDWLKDKLSKAIAHEDTRVQSSAFEVLEEYIKADQKCPMIDYLIEKVFILIRYDETNKLISGLNTLSVLPSFNKITPQQFQQFSNFIKNLNNSPSPLPALRCSALKLIGSLAKDQAIPSGSFNLILDFVLSLRQSTNQNVVINSSLALSFLCMNEESFKKLPEIMIALEEGKDSKKEKIVSSSIISAGNLFETFSYKEIKTYTPQLLEICISGLPHKNAKVGWDACNALFKFFANPSMPHSRFSSQLIPIFLETIRNHHNYRTRINACQLLRDYDIELNSYSGTIISGLISSLETDKKLLLTEFNVLKYQRCFRQEVILSLIYIINSSASLTSEFISSLTDNLLSIYEWFYSFVVDLIKDQNEPSAVQKEYGINAAKGCIQVIVDWIHDVEEIHISFGLLEEMNKFMYMNDYLEDVFTTDSIISEQ
ncbi:unnamed protein product [Blepharisma stoltei]|uniref:DUF4042 domain-containing protein n=1 Tax=Blepharisma stoltei TaxID=1481888 RepID=A0AAU9J9A5_9CILI|nr:unnamed protein product [Blepharisma stoltei]